MQALRVAGNRQVLYQIYLLGVAHKWLKELRLMKRPALGTVSSKNALVAAGDAGGQFCIDEVGQTDLAALACPRITPEYVRTLLF